MREERAYFWRYTCPIKHKRVRTRYMCTEEHASRQVAAGEWIDPEVDSDPRVMMVPETREEYTEVLWANSTSAFHRAGGNDA